MKKWVAFCDGSYQPKYNSIGYGGFINNEDDETIIEFSFNEITLNPFNSALAELKAIENVIEIAKIEKVNNLKIISDNKPIVQQLTGEKRISTDIKILLDVYNNIIESMKFFKKVDFEWVERSYNKHADFLSRLTIEKKLNKKPSPQKVFLKYLNSETEFAVAVTEAKNKIDRTVFMQKLFAHQHNLSDGMTKAQRNYKRKQYNKKWSNEYNAFLSISKGINDINVSSEAFVLNKEKKTLQGIKYEMTNGIKNQSYATYISIINLMNECIANDIKKIKINIREEEILNAILSYDEVKDMKINQYLIQIYKLASNFEKMAFGLVQKADFNKIKSMFNEKDTLKLKL